MTLRKKRKELFREGKTSDRVRVVVDTKEARTVVYYRDAEGIQRRLKFPKSLEGQQEAVAFAEGWIVERKRQQEAAHLPVNLSVRALWQAFKDVEFSDVEGEGLRAATQTNYTGHWKRFERFVGANRDAISVKAPEMARLRKEATANGIALNQIRQLFGVVRTVYRWGVEQELLTTSPLVLLRIKDRKDAQQPHNPDEFTEAEFEAILRALDYTNAQQWRAWVFVMLAGHHGQRARAIRHLRWQDVDLAAGEINWPAKFQKQGKELKQPILWETWSALLTAQHMREAASHYKVQSHHKTATARPERLLDADWVLFAERDKAKPMSYQTMHWHLKEAHKRAGVERKAFRGAHGFKKRTVSRVIAATGDRMLGLQYVGNKSEKLLASYDKTVTDRIQQASTVTGTMSEKMSRISPDGPETQTAPQSTGAEVPTKQ